MNHQYLFMNRMNIFIHGQIDLINELVRSSVISFISGYIYEHIQISLEIRNKIFGK